MHHEANIIHHDIKPENILIDSSDRIKISDFGISISLKPNESDLLTNYDWGTKMFLPPESWTSRRPSPESEMFGRPLDVWALGVTFYKMVYGEGPFGTSFEPKEMGDRIIHDE